MKDSHVKPVPRVRFGVSKGLPQIVAALMLMVAGRGVAQLITEGQIITFAHPALAHLGSGSLFYLPMPVIIACAMLLLLWLLTRKTALGLFIKAVGINVRSARNAGISTR